MAFFKTVDFKQRFAQLFVRQLPNLGSLSIGHASAKQQRQQRHRSLTRPHTANINVRIVSVARKAMAAPFQFLVHFINLNPAITRFQPM